MIYFKKKGLHLRNLYVFLAVFVFGFMQQSMGQQDSSITYQIVLTDGSELIGHIATENEDIIRFKTLSGASMTIERKFILEVEPIEGEWSGGEFRQKDPNETRLLFAPTARTLPKGKGYFSVYEIFFPMLAFGVTDFLTFSGGMSLFPGSNEQILYLAPKLRVIEADNFDLSSGVLYCVLFDESFGIAYGVGTYEIPGFAITAGLGWGFVDDDFSKNPLLMLGAEARISSRLKFITENWFPPETSGGLISFGLRFFGKKLAADFGLITTTESTEGFPFVPWIGFVVNF